MVLLPDTGGPQTTIFGTEERGQEREEREETVEKEEERGREGERRE